MHRLEADLFLPPICVSGLCLCMQKLGDGFQVCGIGLGQGVSVQCTAVVGGLVKAVMWQLVPRGKQQHPHRRRNWCMDSTRPHERGMAWHDRAWLGMAGVRHSASLPHWLIPPYMWWQIAQQLLHHCQAVAPKHCDRQVCKKVNETWKIHVTSCCWGSHNGSCACLF